MLNDSWALPTFKGELCIQCGSCVDVCEKGVIALEEGQPILAHPDECDGCGECEEACPQGGIECSFEIVLGESQDG